MAITNRIPALPEATVAAPADLLIIEQGGITKHVEAGTVVGDIASSGKYQLPATGSVLRTIESKLNEYVSVTDFGVKADGITDINTALTSAINNRPAGRALRFSAGTYTLAGRIDVVLTSPLTLIFDKGAKIVGNAVDVPMLTIRGGAARNPVFIQGGHFDNGDRIFNPAVQSGTALDLLDLDDFTVTDCIFGRKTRDYLDLTGDSGMTVTRCQRGNIVNSTFYGQADLGIYLTGGASTGSTDDYGDIAVSGCHFHRCQTAATSKRQQGRVIYTSNSIYECANGLTVFEAGGIPAGKGCIISNNTFKFTTSNAIRIHGQGGHVVTGNVIEDFGFDRSLTSVAGIGVWNRGGSNNVVSDNIIRFVDWVTDSNHTAISSPQVTIDSILYTPTNNNMIGNIISNVYRGISESTSGANYYGDTIMIGATTPLSGLNAATIAEFTDTTNGKRLFIGATEVARQSAANHYVRNLRFFEAATTATTPASVVLNRYIPINSNGTTYYLPLATAVW